MYQSPSGEMMCNVCVAEEDEKNHEPLNDDSLNVHLTEYEWGLFHDQEQLSSLWHFYGKWNRGRDN